MQKKIKKDYLKILGQNKTVLGNDVRQGQQYVDLDSQAENYRLGKMPRKLATFKRTLPEVTEMDYDKDGDNREATVSATSLHKLEDV
jgi:hypothetical protein